MARKVAFPAADPVNTFAGRLGWGGSRPQRPDARYSRHQAWNAVTQACDL